MNARTKSAPASTESTGWCRMTFGIAGTVPASNPSIPGFVAPATAIVQPSQLMPASQYTWIVLSGPRGRRSRAGAVLVSAAGGWASLATSRSMTAMTRSSSVGGYSADPGQLIARQHVDDPPASDPRLQHDQTLAILHHPAHDPRLPALGPAAHAREDGLRVRLRDDGQELPLVRHVQGVEAEQLAHPAHRLADGDRLLVKRDPDARLPRDLVERGGHAAARGVRKA